MSLSDCPQCWETPCICGHQYECRDLEYLDRLIHVLQGVRKKRAARVLEFVVESQESVTTSCHNPPEGHRIFAESEDPDVLSILSIRSIPVWYWNEETGFWASTDTTKLLLSGRKLRRRFLAVPISVFPLPPLDK